MSTFCVPSLILGTGNLAVNKRSKSLALVELALLDHILKDHAINKVKNRLEAQGLVKKQLNNPTLW